MPPHQLEDAVAQVQEDASKEFHRKLSEAKSWGRSIAEALIGSVVVAFVWGAIVLVLYTNKVGFDRVAKDIFEIDVSSGRPNKAEPVVPAPSR